MRLFRHFKISDADGNSVVCAARQRSHLTKRKRKRKRNCFGTVSCASRLSSGRLSEDSLKQNKKEEDSILWFSFVCLAAFVVSRFVVLSTVEASRNSQDD